MFSIQCDHLKSTMDNSKDYRMKWIIDTLKGIKNVNCIRMENVSNSNKNNNNNSQYKKNCNCMLGLDMNVSIHGISMNRSTSWDAMGKIFVYINDLIEFRIPFRIKIRNFDFVNGVDAKNKILKIEEEFQLTYDVDFVKTLGNRAQNLKNLHRGKFKHNDNDENDKNKNERKMKESVDNVYQPPNCERNRFWEARTHLFASFTLKTDDDADSDQIDFETMIVVENALSLAQEGDV